MANYSDASAFVECQAILAAQEADYAELYRLVGDMLPGERAKLVTACERLADVATNP